MSETNFPVYLIDEITPKPGQAKAVFDLYLKSYAPGAAKRGMTLVHRLVEPAYWVEDGTNRLVFIWTMAGAGATWGKNHMGRQDMELRATWAAIDALSTTRRRGTLVEADDIGRATNV